MINKITGFHITSIDPIDDRFFKDSSVERIAIESTRRHEGLFVYEKDTGFTYQLYAGIEDTDWKKMARWDEDYVDVYNDESISGDKTFDDSLLISGTGNINIRSTGEIIGVVDDLDNSAVGKLAFSLAIKNKIDNLSIGDLTDVSIASVSNGDIIGYDGSEWSNQYEFSTDNTLGGASPSNIKIVSEKALKEFIEAYVSATVYLDKDVVAATTANIDITTDLVNGDVLDGITLSTGDYVLVKDQSDRLENGVRVVQSSGVATRAPEMDAAGEFLSVAVVVNGGTVNGGKTFKCVTEVTTVDTDDVVFESIYDYDPYHGSSTINIDASNNISVIGDSSKGIGVNASGLIVKVDNTSLGYNTSGELEVLFDALSGSNSIDITSDVISAKVNENKGLAIDIDGIYVKINSTLEYDSGTIGMKVSSLPGEGLLYDSVNNELDVFIDENTIVFDSITGEIKVGTVTNDNLYNDYIKFIDDQGDFIDLSLGTNFGLLGGEGIGTVISSDLNHLIISSTFSFINGVQRNETNDEISIKLGSDSGLFISSSGLKFDFSTSLPFTAINIDGGYIDGTIIGENSPSYAYFNHLFINSKRVNNVVNDLSLASDYDIPYASAVQGKIDNLLFPVQGFSLNDKYLEAENVVENGDLLCDIGLTDVPVPGSMIFVEINHVFYKAGNDIDDLVVFKSSEGIPRDSGDEQQGDKAYWKGADKFLPVFGDEVSYHYLTTDDRYSYLGEISSSNLTDVPAINEGEILVQGVSDYEGKAVEGKEVLTFDTIDLANSYQDIEKDCGGADITFDFSALKTGVMRIVTLNNCNSLSFSGVTASLKGDTIGGTKDRLMIHCINDAAGSEEIIVINQDIS